MCGESRSQPVGLSDFIHVSRGVAGHGQDKTT